MHQSDQVVLGDRVLVASNSSNTKTPPTNINFTLETTGVARRYSFGASVSDAETML